MNFKKPLSFFARVYYIILGISILILFLYLVLTIALTLRNDNLLLNVKNMNTIALLAIFLALPGTIDQFIHAIKPQKKKFKGIIICPHCNGTTELIMEEVDQ